MLINKSFKTALLPTALLVLFASSNLVLAQDAQETELVAQELEEAKENPRSILFPSDLPGPYFPEGSELVTAAEDRLNAPVVQGLDLTLETAELSLEDVGLELIEEDKSAYGIFSERQTGLAKNIWQPSFISKIEKLSQALTLPSKSPVMDDIARKLLLSIASAPTGKALLTDEVFIGDNAPNEEIIFDEALLGEFINLRTTKLIERGNLADLVAFLQNVPEGTLEKNMRNTEILLLGGDIIGACEMAKDINAANNSSLNNFTASRNQTVDSEANFWLRMTAFCRIMAEDNMGAQIALDMVSEKRNPDFIFIDLANKLMERSDQRLPFMSTGISSLDPLNYTLLSLLDQPIEAQLIDEASPLILSALVINPNVPPENRFQAAVKSNLAGGVSLDVLKNIYDLQEFSEIEYQNAVRMAEFDDRPLADALLYQAAVRQSIDSEKVEILDAIWNRAILNRDMTRKAKLNHEALRLVIPSSTLINHAHHLARGLLLAGNDERALEWYELVRRLAVSGNPDATKALIDIWPLAALSDQTGSVPWSEDILDLWWNGQMVLDPESRSGKATLLYSLAESLGHKVSDEKWSELLGNDQLVNTRSISLGVWREMIRSVGENKPAEAIILSLIAMGEDGPGGLDAAGVSTIVRLLRSVGLEREARNVVLEALVSNGF
ncbi:MAG: hypothetical protein P8H03_05775 [Emcibacteraceae bacterium]|nr:hypothetical protein [Emcibacteraceae bacterium]MDG1996008.1 hypothetical protein [Emcibacteraceae bacterium]